MKCLSLKMWLPLLLTVALVGCAGMKPAPQPLKFTPQAFESGQKCIYTAKKDNALFILDASLTMGKDGQANFLTAKNFISAVSQSLPSDFPGKTALRTYGHSELQSKKETELYFGLAKHSKADLQKALDGVKYTGGNSPLGVAIEAAAADIEKAGGNAVLVVVSDGTQNYMDDAVAVLKKAKAKLGDKLCVTTVWVGDDAVGKKYLEGVVAAAGCGTAESAAALADTAALAAFVEKTFLVCNPPPPVAAPAPAPAPAPVAAPAPAPVPAPCQGVITTNLTFDFDKATIKPEMVPVLQEAKKIIDECKTATYNVAGHTCNIGTDAYNQKLSERRAAAVVKWLVDNGVAAGRLEGIGYGESKPKYDNKTKEGREMNRRVEFINK
jgi:OOP family OmpA-OmpF porin